MILAIGYPTRDNPTLFYRGKYIEKILKEIHIGKSYWKYWEKTSIDKVYWKKKILEKDKIMQYTVTGKF